MKLPEVPQRTTPGFSFSIVERALFECIATRHFGKSEIQEVMAFFGANPPACAFCGAVPIQRWDHLVPVSKGGDTTLGNIVPACAKCDDSKRDLPFVADRRNGAGDDRHIGASFAGVKRTSRRG